ncbi:hypothetical protein L6452_14768 [Arctium lappa]|uniref:Uncharacterized protein n=1 Tax=Arctium lappa TaxID=4217 RepID=A0ACB9CLX3_ARCLA|nr:hypothetical protein L6452_14768 [Arctium lappa]
MKSPTLDVHAGHSPPSRIAGDIRFCTEVDLAITADLQRLPVERHGVGSHFFLVWKQRRWDYCGGSTKCLVGGKWLVSVILIYLTQATLEKRQYTRSYDSSFGRTRLTTNGQKIPQKEAVKLYEPRLTLLVVADLQSWIRALLLIDLKALTSLTAHFFRHYHRHQELPETRHRRYSRRLIWPSQQISRGCMLNTMELEAKALGLVSRVEMGLIRTFLGFSGFGIGVSAGLVIGCYLFIYFQPTDVKDPIIRPLVERDSETFQSLLPEKPLWVITQILTGYVFRDYNVAKPIIAEQIPKYEF